MSIVGKAVSAGGGGSSGKLDISYTGEFKERIGGVVELLTSGVLTFYRDTVVDLFLVGGGGSGGGGSWGSVKPRGTLMRGAPGGGGGYTKTVSAVPVSVGEYDVVIGSGGAAISGSTSGEYTGNNGGATTILGYTANGGVAGSNVTQMINSVQYSISNANGGSGGGSNGYNKQDGAGGSDGGNGDNAYTHTSYPVVYKGIGQGTTTREFGEASGRLYAGGGGGARYADTSDSIYGPSTTSGGAGGGGNGGIPANTTAGQANTGGGGGTGVQDGSYRGAAGGSGIVCIRVHQE